MIFKKNANKPDAGQGYMSQRKNILGNSSNFRVQEAYKTLRTNIRFSTPEEGCRKFCITSGLAGEGKSITALNLAISFAETGQKVLLIDADLRRPTMARLLIENGAPGLSNILAGLCTEETAIRKEIYPNLDVMFSGEIPPNPSELLSNPRMGELIGRLSEQYDYIFVDTPPVNIVADACIVASTMDGVLFVVRQNQSERDSVRRGINQLKIAGVKPVGFILNGAVEESGKRYRRYGNYKYKSYGYESYGYSRGRSERVQVKDNEAEG